MVKQLDVIVKIPQGALCRSMSGRQAGADVLIVNGVVGGFRDEKQRTKVVKPGLELKLAVRNIYF